jgi:hypothetical protein
MRAYRGLGLRHCNVVRSLSKLMVTRASSRRLKPWPDAISVQIIDAAAFARRVWADKERPHPGRGDVSCWLVSRPYA